MAGVRQHRSAPRIGPVKAVVVDVGWVNGLAAIRSLGRAGIPVFAVDHRSSPLGFRSRYAQPVTVPDPLADEDRFVDAVAKIGGPAVVFPTHDPPLNALARHADRLDGFLFPFPSWERLESIQDKRHQLETARDGGCRHPRDAVSDDRDRGGRACVSGPRQASASRRLQAPVRQAGLSLRDEGRARTRVRGRGAVRADGAGARPGRRRGALQLRELPARGRRAARALQRAQAEAGAAGRRHLPRRRGGLGAGGRGRGAAAPARLSASTGSRRSSSSAIRATAASS